MSGLRHRCLLGNIQCAEPRGGSRWIDFPNDTTDFIDAGPKKLPRIKWCLASQQFVKQHAQAINVTARIDIQAAELRLFRAHVSGRANELLKGCVKGLLSQRLAGGGFSDTKI